MRLRGTFLRARLPGVGLRSPTRPAPRRLLRPLSSRAREPPRSPALARGASAAHWCRGRTHQPESAGVPISGEELIDPVDLPPATHSRLPGRVATGVEALTRAPRLPNTNQLGHRLSIARDDDLPLGAEYLFGARPALAEVADTHLDHDRRLTVSRRGVRRSSLRGRGTLARHARSYRRPSPSRLARWPARFLRTRGRS